MHKTLPFLLLIIGISDIQAQARLYLNKVDKDDITNRLNRILTKDNLPGYSVAVVDIEEVLYKSHVGYADRAARSTPTDETIYQLGSITKAFTGTLLAHMMQDGMISADTRITDLIKGDFKENVKNISVQELATHTSGYPGDFVNRRNIDPPGGPGVAAPYYVHDLHAGLEAVNLRQKSYRYSNAGFGILGRMLEVAGGANYFDLLKKYVLDPAGMTGACIQCPRDKMATAYWRVLDVNEPREPWIWGSIAANGGLAASLDDMIRFSQYFLANRDHPAIADAVQVHYSIDDDHQIGWGWQIRNLADETISIGKVILHGGEVDGFSSILAFSEKYQLAIIVLANTGGDAANQAFVEIVKVLDRAYSR